MSDGLPDREDAGVAYRYLCKTDEKYARACATLGAKEQGVKVAKAIAMGKHDGAYNERERQALCSPEYKLALGEQEEAAYNKILLDTKRKRAVVCLETWRTIESSRRLGV